MQKFLKLSKHAFRFVLNCCLILRNHVVFLCQPRLVSWWVGQKRPKMCKSCLWITPLETYLTVCMLFLEAAWSKGVLPSELTLFSNSMDKSFLLSRNFGWTYGAYWSSKWAIVFLESFNVNVKSRQVLAILFMKNSSTILSWNERI